MLIDVVLLNWNGALDTIACLESLLSQQGVQSRLIVCDNASTDNSIDVLRAWAAGQLSIDSTDSPLGGNLVAAPKPLRLAEYSREQAEAGGSRVEPADVHLIRTGDNLGFAGGCNVGMRFALASSERSSFIWLLNNDTVVEPDALAALVRRASQPDRPDLVGSLLCYYDAPGLVQSLGGGTYSPWRGMSRHIADGEPRRDWSSQEVKDIEASMEYVVGASMFASREFIERVGLMQDDYFLYFEEIDWVKRGRLADMNLSLGFAPSSVVYHKVGASAGTHKRSMLSLHYLTVNRLRVVKRFHRQCLPVARLVVFWEGVKALLKGRLAEAGLAMRVALSPVKV